MAFSDPMFIFDMCIKELKSYTACKRFYVRTQFADVFTLLFKDLNEYAPTLPTEGKQRLKRKSLTRYGKTREGYMSKVIEKEDYIGQSVLLASSLEILVSKMKKYPMELSLWSKLNSIRLGSTHIPWSNRFFHYLNGLQKNTSAPAAVVETDYFVFDEITSRRMATIKLFIRLTHLGNKVTIPMKCPTIQKDSIDSELQSDQYQKVDKLENTDSSQDTGIIKTIYGAGRRIKLMSNKKKNSNKLSDITANETINDASIEIIPIAEEVKTQNKEINRSIASLVRRRSDSDIENNKQIAIRKSRSYSSIELKQRLDTLNYIFGDPNGAYGNKVYCVGYFTVENDDAGRSPNLNDESAKSQKSSSKESEKLTSDKPASADGSAQYTFKRCGSECLMQRGVAGSCMHNICLTELPEEAKHLINIRKCTKVVECEHLNRDRPASPDDAIVLDLSSLTKKCCQIQKIEQVTGGVTGVITAERCKEIDPCYCSCDCRFGFTKKTTYCAICGGYEIVGDEMTEKSGFPPFPCPIYHNIVDKKVGKPKSPEKRGKKCFETEKDGKKGKKKKTDDRFKFNYGYQGIRTYFWTDFFYFIYREASLEFILCLILRP